MAGIRRLCLEMAEMTAATHKTPFGGRARSNSAPTNQSIAWFVSSDSWASWRGPKSVTRQAAPRGELESVPNREDEDKDPT